MEKNTTSMNPVSSEKLAPAEMTPKAAPAGKAKQPTKSAKSVTEAIQLSLAPEKKPSVSKSGKVETSLTPAEKMLRQSALEVITSDIRKETSNIAATYMRIGFKLYCAKRDKLFLAVEVDGKPLKNVYEYADMAFGFKKSSVINFVSICEKFSVLDKNGEPTDTINPQFALFGYTQLSEMLSLSGNPEKLAAVKPEMTQRDIKALKDDQALGQDEDSDNPDAAAKPEKTVCYYGMVTEQTWDGILEKLDKKCRGRKIQILLCD